MNTASTNPTTDLSRKLGGILWFLALWVVGFGIYFSGLKSGRYADDYAFVFHPLPTNPFHFIPNKYPDHPFAYRPIEGTFLLFNQQMFGLETFPLHLVQLTMHVLMSWLLFLYLRSRTPGLLVPVVTSLFMLVSPSNVSAVLGCDTFSQIASALFGFLSLWAMDSYLGQPEEKDGTSNVKPRLQALIWSLVAFAMALFSKENSVAFGLPLFCLAWARWSKPRGYGKALVQAVLLMIPYVLVLAGYFFVRSLVVDVTAPTFNSGRLGINLGSNIVKNLGQFSIAALLPASTVDLFVAAKQRDLLKAGMLASTGLLLGIALILGSWRSPHRHISWFCGLMTLLVLAPVCLFNHVSELYLYSAFPLFAISAGISLSSLAEKGWSSPLGRWTVAVLGLGLVTIQISATHSKATLMTLQGAKLADLVQQILPLAKDIPEKGQLLLLHRPSKMVGYSVFLMDGLQVLQAGPKSVRLAMNRMDIEVAVVTDQDLRTARFSAPWRVLTLQDGKIVKYTPGDSPPAR